MRAGDVMTPTVITVEPDMTVKALAELLSERGISGAPVVDSTGSMIGIVSEGDLLHRTELGTEGRGDRQRSWWLDDFASDLARDYVKSHGSTVKDIMTRDVATVTEDASLGEVATLLETERIKRVPVMRDGKVVGIVSRANLLQALACQGKQLEAATPADDTKIREHVISQLKAEPWTRPSLINVIVQDGAVELWGIVDSVSEKKAVRVAAEVTPGVRAVNDNLIIRPAESGS